MGKDEDPTERNRSGNQNACVNNYSVPSTCALSTSSTKSPPKMSFFQCVMKISTCENEVKKRSTKLHREGKLNLEDSEHDKKNK